MHLVSGHGSHARYLGEILKVELNEPCGVWLKCAKLERCRHREPVWACVRNSTTNWWWQFPHWTSPYHG
jgi:hypothetical protein